MAALWKIAAVKTASRNVILDWLGRDTALQARIDSLLRRLVVMPGLWPMPYYRPLGEGVGEIRMAIIYLTK